MKEPNSGCLFSPNSRTAVMKDVLIACVDGLTGLDEALVADFSDVNLKAIYRAMEINFSVPSV